MTNQQFQTQIKELSRAFNGEYNEGQLVRLFKYLINRDVNQLKRAADWLILNKKFLPSLSEIIAAVNEEAIKDWGKVKDIDKEQAQDFFQGKKCCTQLAKESFQLMRDILDDKIKEPQLYDKILEMESRYPGIGWKENARKVKERCQAASILTKANDKASIFQMGESG